MDRIARRALNEAHHIINTDQTLREMEPVFGVSRTTIDRDLRERLPEIDLSLSEKVDKILDRHKPYYERNRKEVR